MKSVPCVVFRIRLRETGGGSRERCFLSHSPRFDNYEIRNHLLSLPIWDAWDARITSWGEGIDKIKMENSINSAPRLSLTDTSLTQVPKVF